MPHRDTIQIQLFLFVFLLILLPKPSLSLGHFFLAHSHLLWGHNSSYLSSKSLRILFYFYFRWVLTFNGWISFRTWSSGPH